MAKKNKSGVALIAAIVLVLAIYFFFLGNQEGIEVSCSEKSIIGFRTVPPPLMSIYQPTICQVDINATVNGNIVCAGNKFQILNSEKGIFPCNEVRNVPNMSVMIQATFYDSDGVQQIGNDTKTIVFNEK